jgi:hypothetical protein
MVLGLSCRNVSSFCRSRPPLIVFLVSLLCLGVTCVCLAVYTANTTANLYNPDILDWNRLLLEMSRLKFCLTDKTPDTQSHSDLSQVERTVLLKSNLLENQIFLGVGLVPLDGMGLGHMGQNVSVTLRQAKPGPEVCVRVEGRSEVIRNLMVGKNTSCAEEMESNADMKLYKVHSKSHLPRSWCEDQDNFEFSYKATEKLATLLTEGDKEVMVRHLVGTSSLLFCVVFIMLLYAAARGGQSTRKLTSKTKSCSDGRGDMQLLSRDQEDLDDY